MSNDKITEVYESFSQNDTNRLLAMGWVIIAVVCGKRLRNNQPEEGPIYVLGKPEAAGNGG